MIVNIIFALIVFVGVPILVSNLEIKNPFTWKRRE